MKITEHGRDTAYTTKHTHHSAHAGADLENFMTVAHRVWLVSRRGQTKEFCDCWLWGW